MTLLPPANEKSRRFTSLQMVHTHTLEQNWIIGVVRWELNPVNVQLNQMSDVR